MTVVVLAGGSSRRFGSDKLDALLDGDGPGSVRRRPDLTVRATRSGWVARRP